VWSGATINASSSVSCSACGNQSEADDLFCLACGEFLDKVEFDEITIECVECGSMLGNDDILCPSCGSLVSVQ
jgi:uncharacterized membrane protein YvbJ